MQNQNTILLKTRSTTLASLLFYRARTSFAIEAFAPSTGAKIVKLGRLPIVLASMVFFCTAYSRIL